MLDLTPTLGRTLLTRLRATGLETQDWWPADVHTQIRRVYGSILVQQTTWTSAHKALQNLRAAGVLDQPELLLQLPITDLTELVWSAGFHTRKPGYLRSAATWLLEHAQDGTDLEDGTLFQSLTTISGVGPETAHLIMLSTYGRKTFIADAYARKLFTGVGLVNLPKGYLPLHAFASRFCADFSHQDFVDFHALKVLFCQAVARGECTYADLAIVVPTAMNC
ncbi:hypothetical protein V5R04_01350 [Jonesiaceae bacterium BS-20]|uniref:HhH-GPD domain-containing protein n=1 Tax=Jonesiaceae bacterium BS-20 TaxID=3120821 RepID=A0AAU7DYQ4_9MICO